MWKIHILAMLGAASVAAGGSGTVSVNVSVAATYAENTIGSSLLASIDGSTVITSGGALTVEALADDTIEAFGLAVGVSAGGSGVVSINVALSAVAATNLIGNAVRYGGGAHVSVGREERSGTHWAVVRIDDDGPGIPEDMQDQVFFPLISGREGGRGLGRTLAQTLVQRHDGAIHLDSHPGRTCFSIFLPIREREADTPAPPVSPLTPPASPLTSHAKRS